MGWKERGFKYKVVVEWLIRPHTYSVTTICQIDSGECLINHYYSTPNGWIVMVSCNWFVGGLAMGWKERGFKYKVVVEWLIRPHTYSVTTICQIDSGECLINHDYITPNGWIVMVSLVGIFGLGNV